MAAGLGFAPVGITTADPPERRAFLREWLSKGYSGEMAYLERYEALRQDPKLLLDGARSIVLVGLNYARRLDASSCDPSRTRFAAYALGDDYHDVMRSKLTRLLDGIRALAPEVNGRICVDSAPLMERDLAQRAGLGWYGKNTCLINTERGSLFLIGALLLTIGLEPDPPAVGACGTCAICLNACPTGALVAPYTLDARKCISYLTIEQKGSISADLRERSGNWVFGCDVCQDVCPFNHPRTNAPLRAAPTSEPRFAARQWAASPPLTGLLRMSHETFRQAYQGSPVTRAKWRGMMRNACTAAGNSSDATLIEPLTDLAHGGDEMIAEHARWAIKRIKAGAGRSDGADGDRANIEHSREVKQNHQ